MLVLGRGVPAAPERASGYSDRGTADSSERACELRYGFEYSRLLGTSLRRWGYGYTRCTLYGFLHGIEAAQYAYITCI